MALGTSGLPAEGPPNLKLAQPIERVRLTNRLSAAAAYPIVLIFAPAGFGKTTALRQFLAKSKTAILLATPAAVTLEHFVSVFATSCSEFYPQMARPPHEALADKRHQVELYAAWAIANLREADCTIAIDDLQNSDDDPAISSFLVKLTEALHDRLRWVFCSRTHSNLPVTRWQAYGKADAPLSAEDLRITIRDAAELASSLNSPATLSEITKWVDQTNGFPIPITYALRASARRGTIVGVMDGTRTVTFDFLADQLWASLTLPQRAILEVAAFLPELHIHAFDSIGVDDAPETIFRLCDDIAFLALSLDGRFSMHSLFRDFIRAQVSRAGPSHQRDRIATAVKTLFATANYNNALNLLLEANDSAALIQAVEALPQVIFDPLLSKAIVAATMRYRPQELGLAMLLVQTEYWSWFGDSYRSKKYAEEILRRNGAESRHLLSAVIAISRAANFQSEDNHKNWLARMDLILDKMNEQDRTIGQAYQSVFLSRYDETKGSARALIRQIHNHIDELEPRERIDAQIAVGAALYYMGDNADALKANRDACSTALVTEDKRARALPQQLRVDVVARFRPRSGVHFRPFARCG